MEHRALANLAIRMVGFFELVVAFNTVTAILSGYLDSNTRHAWSTESLVLGLALGVGFPLLAGLFLIYFPGVATSKVLRIEGLDSREPGDKTLLESVAIGAMGLWFSVNAVATVAQKLGWIIAYPLFQDSQHSLDWDMNTRLMVFTVLATGGVQFVLGMSLLIGNTAIARLLSRLRVRGLDES
jgi:hypothetical protein